MEGCIGRWSGSAAVRAWHVTAPTTAMTSAAFWRRSKSVEWMEGQRQQSASELTIPDEHPMLHVIMKLCPEKSKKRKTRLAD